MPLKDPEARRAYQRAYREKNYEKMTAYKREWQRKRYREDPEYREAMAEKRRAIPAAASAARAAVHREIQRGNLIRPTVCPECGAEAFIEAAHENYEDHMAIRWLCRSCHRKWDRETPKQALATTRPDFRFKTHCRQGHPFSGENLYVSPKGVRGCRECRRKNMRDFEARRAAKRL